jgi:regulator of protease activity HflC (stomatin/prohibitin superfamily)
MEDTMPFPFDNTAIGGVIIPIVLLLALLFYSIRILREYERGVIFMLGRFWKVKGPGLILVIPFIQQMVRIDLRTRVFDVPSQDVISRDNVTVRVNAVLYFRVIDPERAVIQVEDFFQATSELAQTTLRSVVGQHDLDQMLAERDKINADVRVILDEQTDAWGIKVSNVELKHIDLDESMVRAIAKQAEAERLRRAKIIDAEGEFQAAEKLADAGAVLSGRPEALQLRYLGALMTIANERSSTIVFPLPIDVLQSFARAASPPAPNSPSNPAT